MAGGIDAHLFRLRPAGGSDVALRITDGDAHDDVAYQARVLDFLAETTLAAPRLVAHAKRVGSGGWPVLLQSLLPGDPTLPTEGTDDWLGELVATIDALRGL